MGGKSSFRFIFLLSIIFFAFSLQSYAATCIYSHTQSQPFFCDDVSASSQCQGGTFDARDKSQISNCNTGCCCVSNLSTGQKFVAAGECSYYSSSLRSGTVNNASIESYLPSPGYACDAICSNISILPQCDDNCGTNSGRCLCGGINSSGFCCGATGTIFSNQNTCQNACSSVPSQNSISGYVYLSGTTTNPIPISGVSLTATGKSPVISDSQGYFVIENVVAVTGSIYASKVNYITSQKSYNLSSSVTVTIYLSPSNRAEDCGFTSSQDSGLWDFDQDGCPAKYDSSCSPKNINETNSCNDGVDNDCNGLTDCEDQSCAKNIHCTASPGTLYCGDGKIGNGTGNPQNTYGTVEVCDKDSDCPTGMICADDCKSCIPNQTITTCGNGILDGGEACDPSLPGLGCNPGDVCTSDCQCRTQVACGNGRVDLPLEQCDFVGNQIAPNSVCSFDQCIKIGDPGECLCRTIETCGNNQFDGLGKEECDILANGAINGVCTTPGSCDLATCSCLTCLPEQKVPLLSLSRTISNVSLNWSTSCSSVSPNYTVTYCSSNLTTSCTPDIIVNTTNSRLFVHKSVLSGRNYCYAVNAVYFPLENYSSLVKCTNASSVPECVYTGEYCEGNSVFSCENGKKTMKKANDGGPMNCSLSSSVCIATKSESTGFTSATCHPVTQCDRCNGWFSIFSSLDLRVDNQICFNAPSCYLDYTPTTVDKYESCFDEETKNQVSSCYNYKSESACVKDKCGVLDCEWKNLTGKQELGVGVCRPKEVAKQNCNFCNDYSLNNFFGTCTRDYCMNFGDECYFDSSDPLQNFGQCLNKYEMSCEGYKNKNDCIGGRNSSIDNTWGINDVRLNVPVSGSNAHSVLSNDFLNFTYCRWDDSIDFCYKDGDGDKSRDCDGGPSLSGNQCYRDFAAPESFISFSNPQKARLNIDFSIIDNETDYNVLHYKVVKKGQVCYPNSSMSSPLTIQTLGNVSGKISYLTDAVGNSDNYTLCYFAEDVHRNFEVVKSQDFVVDAVNPDVSYSMKSTPFEVNVSLPDGEDYVFLSNVTITAKVRESAKCNFWLNILDGGGRVSNEVNIRYLNSTTNFTKDYNALEDGTYIFHAECIDLAGNENSENNKTFVFTLDADKHITNLLPKETFGPNNVTSNKIRVNLSVDTQDDAVCRYSISKTSFSSMTPFTSTGTTHHTTPIEYVPSTSIKAYYIKCNFTSEKRVYGNNGDRVIFALDFDAPDTYFTLNGEKFTVQTDWYRKSTLSDLNFECMDKLLYLDNNNESINFASGCKEVRYSLANNTETLVIPPIRRLNISSKVIFPDQNNIFEIAYNSVDFAGNNDTLVSNKFIKVDDEPLSFTFKIYDPAFGQDVLTVTKGRTYFVHIFSSKKVPSYDLSYGANISQLGFTFNGVQTFLGNITRKTGPDDSSLLLWTANLYLSGATDNFKDKTGQATFFISAIDTHGVTGTSISDGKDFTINTVPPDAPVIDPGFESKTNGFEFYYGERFHGKDGIYYTNDKNLFVSGSSKYFGVVKYYLNNMNKSFSEYDMAQNAEGLSPYASLTPFRDLEKGSSSLLFDGIYSELKGQYADFLNYKRTEYKSYRTYYEVSDVSQSSGSEADTISYLSLLPVLEQSIPKSVTVNFYTKPHPHDWFGLPLDLSLGMNAFSVKVFDVTGNRAETVVYPLFYDPYPPLIENIIPSQNSITALKNQTLTIMMSDVGAGLETDDPSRGIRLVINGVKVTPDIAVSEFVANDGLKGYNYTISYTPDKGFNGTYEVEFSSMDMAANRADKNWTFKVDPNSPSSPIIRFEGLTDANYVPGYDVWYTNKVRNFTLNYSSDYLGVSVDNIDLYFFDYDGTIKPMSGPQKKDIVSCSITGFNYYFCKFKDTSDVSSDAQYALKISASKNVNGVRTRGSDFKFFVMDTTPPDYTLEYDNTTNSNANLTFIARIINDEKFLDAFIQLEGHDVESLTSLNNGVAKEYIFSKPFSFLWDVTDDIQSEDYSFVFTLQDKAGNEKSGDYMIRIDNEPPFIAITNFTVTNKYENNLKTRNLANISEISNNGASEENVRFKGASLDVIGTISKTTKYQDYDIKNITISQRDFSGHILSDNMLTILPCTTGEFKNCIDTRNQNRPTYGEFVINDYLLENEEGKELNYYFVLEVEDEAENVRYFTLYVVSDQKPPNSPKIVIGK